MIRYFMADPHFGHDGIINMMARVDPSGKLFKSVEDHDTHIMECINNTVGVDDQLFIVGDFAWSKPGRYRPKINSRYVKLIRGNHDPFQKCLSAFGAVPDIARTKIRNNTHTDHFKVFLTHYPTMYWDGSHRGVCHLYGHTHGQREEYLDLLEPERRALDVGVDNLYRLYGNYNPISEYDVYDYMNNRKGHDNLDFYREYQKDLHANL